MIQKKICLLGAFSVGKTSLIRRFVSSMFDEKYLTTIGVKIDKKLLQSNDTEVSLMIWDLAGEDDYNKLHTNYLRGASGYIVVIDGTRPKTVDTAIEIQQTAIEHLGDVPCVAALNKSDLTDDWLVTDAQMTDLSERFMLYRTSARTGDNVEQLFKDLTTQML